MMTGYTETLITDSYKYYEIITTPSSVREKDMKL